MMCAVGIEPKNLGLRANLAAVLAHKHNFTQRFAQATLSPHVAASPDLVRAEQLFQQVCVCESRGGV